MMRTTPTNVSAGIFNDAGDALSEVENHALHLGWLHDNFTTLIRDADELPLHADLHAAAEHAQKLVEAAQQYRRKNLYLLALAGGYDRQDAS